MRPWLVCVATAVALTITALTPDPVQAQVRAFPSINTSPYARGGYAYPAYNSGYGYGFPGYQTWSYGWSNPYSTWNWSSYRYAPYYSGYRSGPRFGRYRGWRRW